MSRGRGGFSSDLLGTIWVQEGPVPIAGDADSVLRGAAAVAARLDFAHPRRAE